MLQELLLELVPELASMLELTLFKFGFSLCKLWSAPLRDGGDMVLFGDAPSDEVEDNGDVTTHDMEYERSGQHMELSSKNSSW